jgi:hypothetical protein
MTAGRDRYGRGYNQDGSDDFGTAMLEYVNHSEMIVSGA